MDEDDEASKRLRLFQDVYAVCVSGSSFPVSQILLLRCVSSSLLLGIWSDFRPLKSALHPFNRMLWDWEGQWKFGCVGTQVPDCVCRRCWKKQQTPRTCCSKRVTPNWDCNGVTSCKRLPSEARRQALRNSNLFTVVCLISVWHFWSETRKAAWGYFWPLAFFSFHELSWWWSSFVPLFSSCSPSFFESVDLISGCCCPFLVLRLRRLRDRLQVERQRKKLQTSFPVSRSTTTTFPVVLHT